MRRLVKIGFVFLIFTQFCLSDLIDTTKVGPGVTFYHHLKSIGPWHIQILEIDQTNPWLSLETVKANDLLYGNEKTSAMVLRNDREQHKIVGAINGDFYAIGGIPIGAQVLKGELLKKPYPRSVFGSDREKLPLIDILSFNGSIMAKNDSMSQINGINESRNSDNLIIYNHYFGSSTQTNQWGTEIIASNIDTSIALNVPRQLVVTAKDSIMATGHGNNNIPGNGLVISGHGVSASFLNQNIFVGDTITVMLNLPPIDSEIIELIGGTPRLIRDSVATVEWQNEGLSQSFATNRHPRTAVGFSKDSTKIYFFTVDGRQPGYSVGMSLYELSDYMMEWGVYQGVNLDGGGSTTMIVRGNIVNSPSDAAGERPVANALMVVSSAPTGPISIINIKPDEPYIMVGDSIQFSIDAFDQYYNPISSWNDSLLNWSCQASIGLIKTNGLFVADTNLVSGFVYAEYDGALDSVLVHITDIASIELQPNPVILEIGEQQQMLAKAKDNYSNIINISPDDYQWMVTDSIGSISASGLFTATGVGVGQISANYREVSGVSQVSVGISNDVIIDDFSSISNWNLTGIRVNLSACSLSLENIYNISTPTSGKLDYSLTTGGTSALYMNCSIPISGSPNAIGIHVYGDGKEHWLRGEFEDNDGEKFLINFTEAVPGINWINTWNYLEKSFDDAIIHWGNPNAVLTFPITWKKIYLVETDDGKKDVGTIYLDDFKVKFITTNLDTKIDTDFPLSFCLHQNYPNPFNPETTINYSIPYPANVKLSVFDIQGKLIDTIVNYFQKKGQYSINWNADKVASGIYFYQLKAKDKGFTKKMIVLR